MAKFDLEYGSLSRKDFDDYKKRLARALKDEGLDAEAIGLNPIYKEYMVKYVEDYTKNMAAKDCIQGITQRLAVMDLDIHGDASVEHKAFPIINRHKGHYIFETVYFRKTPENGIEAAIIPVKKSTIIIP